MNHDLSVVLCVDLIVSDLDINSIMFLCNKIYGFVILRDLCFCSCMVSDYRLLNFLFLSFFSID